MPIPAREMDSTTPQLLPVDANGGHGAELSDRHAQYRDNFHALDQQHHNNHAFYTSSFPTWESSTANHTAGSVLNNPETDTSIQHVSFTSFNSFTDLLHEDSATGDGTFDFNDSPSTRHQLPPGESSQETAATSPPVDSSNRIAIAPPQSGQQPDRQEWEAKKPLLKTLYIREKKTAPEIAEIMARQHNFHASVDQFRNKLAKWKFGKYLSRHDKHQMILIRNWRKAMEGRDTEFWVDNQRVPEEKLTRFIRTYGNPALERPGAIPDWLDCRTPHPPPNFQRQERPHTDRVPLMLAPDDLEALEAFRSHESEMNLGCFQHRASQLLAVDYSLCHDCYSLRASVSRNAFASMFDSTVPALDMTDPSLVAVLRLAIQNREDALVKHLVRRCQQRELAQRIHRQLFCVALKNQRGTLFCQLLLHGLDVNVVDGGRGTANRSLLAQAQRTLREIIIALLDSNEMMNDTARVMGFMYRVGVLTPDFWKEKVLWKALKNGRADILHACLLQPTYAVLDLDTLMKKAGKIRRIIQETGSSEAAEVLVTAAISNNGFGATALHLATTLLLENKVQALLDEGVNVNERNEAGETALHIIAGLPSDGNRVARLLITNGADVTAMDSVGDTVLHKAIRSTWPPWKNEFASVLLDKGADINALNHRSETPFFVAAQNFDVRIATETMTWLLDKGAHPRALDCDGNVALGYYHWCPWVNALGAWGDNSLLDQPWNWNDLDLDEQQQTSETSSSQRADLLRARMESLGYRPM